jgi:DNA end-binding protein Ku
MSARAVWKGYLRFSLVSVPVAAYTTSESGGGEIHLNQLHRKCHGRIRYRKTCETCGTTVDSHEIISGYPAGEGRYIPVEKQDLTTLKAVDEKGINLEAFIGCDAIDPRQYAGKSYALLPDGKPAQKPYALLHRAMSESKRYGLSQMVMSGRDNLVLIRPVGKVLLASFLHFNHELRDLAQYEAEVPNMIVNEQELKLAKQLTEALAVKSVDLTPYKDRYREGLAKLVEDRLAKENVVASPEPMAQIINLMDALKKSVERTKPKLRRKAS